MSKVSAALVGAGAAWLAAPWIAMARHGTTDQRRSAALALDDTSPGWPTVVPLPRTEAWRSAARTVARSA